MPMLRASVYPNTQGRRVYPGPGMLFRRWEPGQGYEGWPGITGLGLEAPSGSGEGDGGEPDPSSGEAVVTSSDPYPYIDPETGLPITHAGGGEAVVTSSDPYPYIDPETGLPITHAGGDSGGGSDWQAQSDCAEFGGSACAKFVMTGGLPMPQDVAKTATVNGALLTPAIASAITSGLKAGTVVAASSVGKSCPTGYVIKATGQCVGGSAYTGGITHGGQWFSFATNQQVITWGLVVAGGLLFVSLVSRKR